MKKNGLGIILLLIVISFSYKYFFYEKKEGDNDNRTVYIKYEDDGGYQLMRNESPFIIKGASGNRYLEELVASGGNTIRVYDTVNLHNFLNKAHSLGLAVIVDIPIPRYNESYNIYENKEYCSRLKKEVKSLISKHKDHPALLLWNLGNEVEYPFIFGNRDFINAFNGLIKIIHAEDPNHPVSTTIPSVTKKQVLSIMFNSPDLDLIGFNIFVAIKRLDKDLEQISLLKKPLPYYISEWGYDGPWAAKNTLWKAPIEQSSNEKMEQLISRYHLLQQKIDHRCLGSLIFYWGSKQEGTHTWFSLFSEEGHASEMTRTISGLWNGSVYKPDLKINGLKINNKNPTESLILKPGTSEEVSLSYTLNSTSIDSIKWELYREGWYYKRWDIEKKPLKIPYAISVKDSASVILKAPQEEGPYRLFAYLYSNNHFTTINYPFYVTNIE